MFTEKIEAGSVHEETMLDILGPDWKLITCLGATQDDTKVAPGYTHDEYWPRVLAHESGGKFYKNQFYLPEASAEQTDQTDGQVLVIQEETEIHCQMEQLSVGDVDDDEFFDLDE